jgi:hypothetical protein
LAAAGGGGGLFSSLLKFYFETKSGNPKPGSLKISNAETGTDARFLWQKWPHRVKIKNFREVTAFIDGIPVTILT